MHIEAFYHFCMDFPGAKEDFPFDENTLVFKVMGKMFALADVDEFESINLKCDPVRALELRAAYEEVQPGYHMNKKHWNTVSMQGNLPDDLIKELIKHSYELVVAKLPKKEREKLC
ncbi:MmcQ/YjbR family DNA-binding protein [Gracilimonas mengyeensis]|uniref:Predicted DNA-binding protein, MmcQ/YjbR family n=1 Tax=Gracilimonas mengyeensis TaxID=1302730 RepID=A0A521CWH1_9BACT|nr:MmcQ/YjbR family DNA-binding protein [Gracilimonas mengyeensis]SMO63787.1 Predicted DNA-binding protein, MmcQ/YjbR family [Gracilimonas mengyeensis]